MVASSPHIGLTKDSSSVRLMLKVYLHDLQTTQYGLVRRLVFVGVLEVVIPQTVPIPGWGLLTARWSCWACCLCRPAYPGCLSPSSHAPWSPVVCAAWKLSIINLSLRQIYQISFSLQLIDKEVILHPVLFRDQDSLAETMRRKINWKFSILELGC